MKDVPEWNGIFGVRAQLAKLKVLDIPEPYYYVLEHDLVKREKRREVCKVYSELSIRQQRKRWRHFCEYVERSIAQREKW